LYLIGPQISQSGLSSVYDKYIKVRKSVEEGGETILVPEMLFIGTTEDIDLENYINDVDITPEQYSGLSVSKSRSANTHKLEFTISQTANNVGWGIFSGYEDAIVLSTAAATPLKWKSENGNITAVDTTDHEDIITGPGTFMVSGTILVAPNDNSTGPAYWEVNVSVEGSGLSSTSADVTSLIDTTDACYKPVYFSVIVTTSNSITISVTIPQTSVTPISGGLSSINNRLCIGKLASQFGVESNITPVSSVPQPGEIVPGTFYAIVDNS
jgi:hypothetical protein